MSERVFLNPEEQREAAMMKAARLADDLRKLEKGVISEADEATQIARSSLQHMRVAVKKRLKNKS